MAKTIFVRAARQDRRVALSEGDAAHPGGEAWVVGYPPGPDGKDDPANIVEVGQTALVKRLLAEGTLIEVDAPAKAVKVEAKTAKDDDKSGNDQAPKA